MRSRTYAAIVIPLTLLYPAAPSDAGAIYSVTDLSGLPGALPDTDLFYGTGLNNRGQVLGNGYIGHRVGPDVPVPLANPRYSYVISGGRITPLTPASYHGQPAVSLDDSGQVLIGWSADTGPTTYRDGTIRPTGTSKDVVEVADSNNSGTILGAPRDSASSPDSAFIQVGEERTRISGGPGTVLSPVAINDAGQAVLNRSKASPSGGSAPVVYENGTIREIGTPADVEIAIATGINASGQVVGMARTGALTSNGFRESRAALWSDGTMHDLGTLGGPSSFGLGINAKGEVVGSSRTAGDAADHAFLYSDGAMLDLNDLVSADLGLTLERAMAINDLGQILGAGKFSDGRAASVLLTPDGVTIPPTPVLPVPSVPEPTTLALFGLAGLAAWLRRRRRP